LLRKAYGESIDLPDIGRSAFSAILGVSATAYAAYENGQRAPTIDSLVSLRNKTGVSLDWLLDPNEPGRDRPLP
jgi:transcriptional regulator with XRE-family HTH domain